MNIYVVAKSASVSTSSVSRYLNGTGCMRPETAERIRRAINDLGFEPDLGAVALTRRQSRLLGLILSDFANPDCSKIFSLFADAATAGGYDTLASATSSRNLKACLIPMIQRRVEGIAVVGQEIDTQLSSLLRQQNIPVTLMDAPQRTYPVNTVRFDYDAGVLMGLRHLRHLGHRNVALMTVPNSVGAHFGSDPRWGRTLLPGTTYPYPAIVKSTDGTFEGAYEIIKSLLLRTPRPTAVMCLNELCVLGTIRAINEASLRIPENISLVSFNDSSLRECLKPAMTTIALPWCDLVTVALRTLIPKKQDDDLNTIHCLSHTLKPLLIVRESTRFKHP